MSVNASNDTASTSWEVRVDEPADAPAIKTVVAPALYPAQPGVAAAEGILVSSTGTAPGLGLGKGKVVALASPLSRVVALCSVAIPVA